jgi:hypothetical protein
MSGYKAGYGGGYPKELWAKVREAVEVEGLSYRECEARYGVGFGSIGQKAKKEGWTVGIKFVERMEARKRVEEERREAEAERVKVFISRHKETMLELNLRSRRHVAEIVERELEYLLSLSEEELAGKHAAVRSFVNCGESLFGWKQLQDVESAAAREVAMREAGARDTSAINLRLIATKPDELKRLAQMRHGGVSPEERAIAGQAGGGGERAGEEE